MDALDPARLADAFGATTSFGQTWILPVLLGLGLASATGLRTFLPLLMLAVSARFGLFGVELSGAMSWLGSWAAIGALAVAAAAEFLGDKVPVIDHGLNVAGTVVRPIAGAIAAASVFAHLDPTTAAVAGVIVGAPTAFAFNAFQGGTRVASTATTGGLGNPILSFIEDVLSFLTVLVAFVLPILIPVLMIVVAVLVFRLARRLRERLYRERTA